jgi:hypothetical protein
MNINLTRNAFLLLKITDSKLAREITEVSAFGSAPGRRGSSVEVDSTRLAVD